MLHEVFIFGFSQQQKQTSIAVSQEKISFLLANLLIPALGFLEYVYQVSGRIRSIIRIANKKQNFPSMIPVATQRRQGKFIHPP